MIELANLIQQCAPGVAPATIQAIMRTESGFNSWALNVNGNVRLRSAPRSAAEAASWSQWLIDRGYSVDMGLMQINSRNLPRLKLTAAQIFDPCTNIRAGATILSSDYQRAAQIHGEGSKALLSAISSYNTGSFERGFRNGYVDKVIRHSSSTSQMPPLVSISQPPGGRADSTQRHSMTEQITSSMSSGFSRARTTILVSLTLIAAVCVHMALRAGRRNQL